MSENAPPEDWLVPFYLSPEKLRMLASRLATTYKSLALHSEDQFLATPIVKLPTGHEQGEFLAIDLGGSNLRVAFVKLLGCGTGSNRLSLDAYDDRIEKDFERAWPIGENLKVERAEDLFAWLGQCLAEVIEARIEGGGGPLPDEVPLAVAFSFPMMQSSLSEATLLPMGKGFEIKSNPDLGAMISKGYERHTTCNESTNCRHNHLPRIKLVAIANDAVATLISLSYTARARPNSKAVVGLIMGTGCNAAIPLKPTALKTSKVEFASKGTDVQEIVVNTELTIRGVGETLRGLDMFTKFDEAIDSAVSTPGFQPFEYMTAGAYLGEIVRLTLLDRLQSAYSIQIADLPPGLIKRNALTTTYLGHNVALATDPRDLAALLNESNQLGQTERFAWTSELAGLLMNVERAVARRSAAMIAAAIIALLVCAGEVTISQSSSQGDEMGTGEDASRELIVAYCGGLICLYGDYLQLVRTSIDDLMKTTVAEKNTKVVLREASEGGVIGAGVLAGTVWPPSKCTDPTAEK